MLAVDKVSIQYGGRVLMRDLGFVIGPKDRLSFVGPNGAGKSTLMKIITGDITPDSGAIVKAKYITVGYLPQEGIRVEGRTLFQEAETAFEDALALQKKLELAGDRLAELEPDSAEYAEALEICGEMQLHLEHHDVARMKPRIERVLTGLGFVRDDFDRPTGEFSGGWQMRIALAKLLLREPSVLLLDEPTNHLDLDSVRWLEGYLRNYNGSLILISHDRSLLDALVTRTLAFVAGRVEEYAGNYSFFERESVARREQLVRQARNQDREIRKSQEFIDRFRSKATKASLVQSRIKQLAKIERIELESEDSEINFRFPPPPRGGQIVARLEGVEKSYGDHPVFSGLDLQIDRGDRIAIVGVNGAGKSTFSRVLSGVEPVTGGSIKLGHNARLSHFAQNHAEELDPAKQVLTTVDDVASSETRPHLRTLLGSFLFRGDDVFKLVAVLSGGERSRLALARMLLQPANFLILDEPTNHLDMRSQEVLQRALADYAGTYVIVSHNRSFLDPIVTKVLEFRRGGLPPRVFHGNVSDYIEKIEAEAAAEAESAKPGGQATTGGGDNAGAGRTRRDQRRLEGQQRQERSRKLKPLQDKLQAVEDTIAEIETRRAELEGKMGDADFCQDADAVKEAADEYRESAKRLEKAYTDWGEVSEETERVEKALNAGG